MPLDVGSTPQTKNNQRKQLLPKSEWIRQNNNYTLAEEGRDAAAWLANQNVGFIGTTVSDTYGKAIQLPGADGKGKCFYICKEEFYSGYQTFSVFLGFNRASERADNRFYPDGYKIRNRRYNEYLGKYNDDTQESARQAALNEALRRQKEINLSRAEREAAEKARNLKKAQQTFGSLSKEPKGNQDGYIKNQ